MDFFVDSRRMEEHISLLQRSVRQLRQLKQQLREAESYAEMDQATSLRRVRQEVDDLEDGFTRLQSVLRDFLDNYQSTTRAHADKLDDLLEEVTHLFS
jgi:hypothetical protein